MGATYQINKICKVGKFQFVKLKIASYCPNGIQRGKIKRSSQCYRKIGGTMPEDLPTPEKSIQEIEKEQMARLKAKAKAGELMLDEQKNLSISHVQERRKRIEIDGRI